MNPDKQNEMREEGQFRDSLRGMSLPLQREAIIKRNAEKGIESQVDLEQGSATLTRSDNKE